MLKTILDNIFQHPKTSLSGALALAAALAPIWLPQELAHKVQQSALLIGGAGLLGAAKDS